MNFLSEETSFICHTRQ